VTTSAVFRMPPPSTGKLPKVGSIKLTVLKLQCDMYQAGSGTPDTSIGFYR